ncbi:transcriptional regulator GutM [Brevibacillus humidisoli]|uniref:transcriptional regulator GutM n=1 Tax=Brevibacillus humidisoli TaxID=2895522 RepID=UPI001E61F660|nr:transcriptional regulator GutM [Brevibacillus humidisoli]UFJ42357.1 transcriptional regulator GutM [Brevibacillus humidisoli]
MASWGIFILVFVGMWLLQVYFTLRQSKHYQQHFYEMQQQANGYMGVGVSKRRFGRGAVVMITTDQDGIVTRCKQMSGLTVFARFRERRELVGKPIEVCRIEHPRAADEIALNMAIEKVEEQRRKHLE